MSRLPRQPGLAEEGTATCLVLAIRTAKWPAHLDEKVRECDLDREIEFQRILSAASY